ncbi:MAG: UPF0280 family protein [Thermodesulfobacteriota bacterium]
MAAKAKKTPRPAPLSYRRRDYRRQVSAGNLAAFSVQVRETDLQILACRDLTAEASAAVLRCRCQIEGYLAGHPAFLPALTPLPDDPLAPPIVREMLRAALLAGVGPMAAVAGAVAEAVGRVLLACDGVREASVENGGDIFLARREECVVAIFAGASPLSSRVGLRISPGRMPLGICTSSGTVGHSLSFGTADAVTVLAASTALADAAATRIGNEVRSVRDLDRALAVGRGIAGVEGLVVIKDDQLGAWGEVELVRLDR